MTDPKILVVDIETTPITALVWGLRDQNISLSQIVKDWSVMAWGAKWFNKSGYMYRDQRKAPSLEDDRAILKDLWAILDEADILITQNGQSFDAPKLNARFMLHGMKPPSPYKHLDTYRIVKKVAEFTSNKLEYLTDKLCVKYKKLNHGKFPGMSLWTECMKGNMKAWDEMKRYNIHDVLSTEELYNTIKAWAPETMITPHVASENKCGICGKLSLQKRGLLVTKKLIYQRYHCQSCGAWSKGGKI